MGKIIDKMATGIMIACYIGPFTCLIVLVIIIGLFKECTGSKIDPMDNSIMVQMHAFKNLYITDSTYNGFEVVYQTTRPVTDARLDEIRNRKHVEAAFEALEKDAPLHFPLMLDTDIYEFAEFAKKYDSDPDVKINAIFVFGGEKQDMYRRPNPMGDKFATLDDIYTEQGIQYITSTDIYPYTLNPKKIYRYWQCSGTWSTSSTDERFSHVMDYEVRPF